MSRLYKIVIHEDAVDELDHIYQLISQDSKTNAKRFIKYLKQNILNLKKFPRRGSLCKIINHNVFNELRFITHNGYQIFYDIDAEIVKILHIAGPGQEWLSFFS